MERDFLGLKSKDSLVVVKEEVNNDGYKEIGFAKRSGVQWPFSNKVPAVPQMMSFNFAQGDKTKKVGSDSLVSAGFMPIATSDAAEVQAISVSASNPFMKNHFAAAGQHMPVATMKPQLLGGIPVTTPQSVLPTLSSAVGSTESWKSAKASGSPAQMTIFYAGTVNVYDDITPEKAQAIMLLAGNGASMASNVAHPKVQVQTTISKPVQVDSVPANQLVNTQLSCGLPSPLSVSSHIGGQSRSGSTSTDEQMVCKTTGTPASPVSKVEPQKVVNTVGSVSATSMIPSVPQARKASLARFLEKRKERVMSAAPYSLGNKALDCPTLESSA
ncbi:Tify [Corchorus olitorius]|uniref:Protein TIFY n=1 Tax=Corchorus olitorius TaxID=93759 RepID=A0A1R3JY57_9ROSI|nr:Tify [Corchorus olitorius]